MTDSPAFYEERIRLLQAENQRLRSLIGAYVTEGLRSQPDREAIDAAAGALVKEIVGAGKEMGR